MQVEDVAIQPMILKDLFQEAVVHVLRKRYNQEKCPGRIESMALG